jgi:hypothetical protein
LPIHIRFTLSSLSRSNVVGCGRKVAERVKKTTSVPETKKKEELPKKLSLMIRRTPQPDEIHEDHTTPTSLSMLPPRLG